MKYLFGDASFLLNWAWIFLLHEFAALYLLANLLLHTYDYAENEWAELQNNMGLWLSWKLFS